MQHYYNDAGEKTASFELAPYPHETSEALKQSETPETCACAMSVPVGQWHALETLEEGSIIFECKDGAYQPLSAEDILELAQEGK